MSNRRRQDSNPLGKPAGNADLFKMDEAIHGLIRTVDEGMQTAYPISIFEVQPDPKQPRRVLPGSLRYTPQVSDVLATWWDLASDEAGREIPVEALLKGEATERSQENVDRGVRPIEAGFMKLIDLAATIRRDGGLINPITVYRVGATGYQLETGERRWLAHHLLAAALNESAWEKITAREVAAPSIWRQAHENTARDDLNAISLARQLALLLMDIYREQGGSFLGYDDFGHDRHFYAQVADGHLFPIPYGDGERVVSAMGLKNRIQVNQYRALLRLPDTIWQKGDEEGWTENKLRTMVAEAATLSAKPAAATDMQAHESITTVIDSPQPQNPHPQPLPAAQGGEPGTPPAADEPATGLPKPLLDLLDWAYRRTAGALNEQEFWFSAANAGTSPEKLNQLAAEGYLSTRRAGMTNTVYAAAFYRVAEKTFEALGMPALDFTLNGATQHLPPGADRPGFNGAARPAIPETAARSGSQPAAPQTPPRRSPVKIFTSSERALLTTAMDLTNERLIDADGLGYAIQSIEQAISVLNRKLADLRMQE